MLKHPERGRIAYLAFDLPYKGQASYTHIHEIMENLRRLGWQVDLFAPKPESHIGQHNIRRKIARYFRVICDAVSHLGEYDILYVRAHPLAWPVSFAARRKGLKVAQEVNGTELDVIVSHPWLNIFRSLVRRLYLSQYRVANYLFPVTSDLENWLRRSIGHPAITMISNAANTDLFRPIDRKDAEPFVVFFGTLTLWHGVDTMVAALRRPEWPESVKLLVIGVGTKSSAIEDAVRAGLPVQWLGLQPYEKIPELVAGAIASLIVIGNPQSRSSTGVLPLKLYETLACGIPAIVSDLPGQAELVRDGQCGLVIPCDDAAALADAVARLAADRDAARAMGERGAALVRAKHSWAARAAQIDAILQESTMQAAR